MVTVGFTEMLVPVPMAVPPHDSVYQCHVVDPFSTLEAFTDNVTEEAAQTVESDASSIGAAAGVHELQVAPVATAPVVIKLELDPNNVKLVSVPLYPFPLASVNVVIAVLFP